MAGVQNNNLDAIEAGIVAGTYTIRYLCAIKGLLHDAVRFERKIIVDYLLDHRMDINKRNKERSTCLHIAAKGGLLDMVQYLTERGANINSRNTEGALPMHEAARSGHLVIVAFFLDQEVGINETDKQNWTVLHHSAYAGHLGIVKYLVESGADIDAKTKANLCEQNTLEDFLKHGRDTYHNSHFFETPIHLAARSGHLDVVEFLVYCGGDVSPHHDVFSVIHLAASYDRKEVVQFFITQMVSINETDVFDRTPLHCAATCGHLDTVEYLVQSPGQKVLSFLISKSREIQDVPLQCDIEEPVVSGILRKLDVKVKVDLLKCFGHMPVALIERHLETIESLLGAPTVELDAQDKAGYTPLHLACMNERITSVNCLLESGANPHVKDHRGRTAIYYYLQRLGSRPQLNAQVEICKRTIDCLVGSCVDTCDENNESPAHVASKNCKNLELLRCVLQKQKNLNVENVGGKTALDYFMDSELPIEDRVDLIRLFIEKGACLNINHYRNIIVDSSLKDRLFKDVQLCTQAIVNKFYQDLAVLYSLVRATPLPPSMTNLKPNTRAIQLHVRAEIDRKGYCNVLKIPILLTMLCADSLVNQTGFKRRRL